MRSTYIVSVITFILFTINTIAQRPFRGNYWKQERKEILFGIGPSNFLGELGGKDQIGSDFYNDLELKSTKYVANLSFRYYFTRNLSVRSSLSYGMVSGDDALTNEVFRNNRNLSFKSPITELSILGEYHLIKERYGKRYKIRGARGSQAKKFGIVGFAGIGLAHFNPKAQYTDGLWYNLKPLGTEGQGLDGGPGEYSNFTFVMPFGFGIKYVLAKQWKLGLNLGIRKTFTDYMDDVSGTYFDKGTIIAENGPIAGYFSDPSLSPINPESELWQTRPGEVRGDSSDKDSYVFGVVSLGYTLIKKRGYRRVKRKGAVPSF